MVETNEGTAVKRGDLVRFVHLHEPAGRVRSVDPDGMVEIAGWAGLFAPHLLAVVDAPTPAQAERFRVGPPDGRTCPACGFDTYDCRGCGVY